MATNFLELRVQIVELIEERGADWLEDKRLPKVVAGYFALQFPTTQTILVTDEALMRVAKELKTELGRMTAGRDNLPIVSALMISDGLELPTKSRLVNPVLVVSENLPDENARRVIASQLRNQGLSVAGFAATRGWCRANLQPACATIFDA